MALSLKVTIGDCECCDKTKTQVTLMHGNMMMCDDCITRENSVKVAEKVIVESRAQDSRIISREDVMTAVTTSFIELHGAYLANPDVAPESKKFALANDVTERIKVMDAAIFAAKAQLAGMEQERFAWLKNLQPLVSTLRAEEQAKFKQFNVNYKPADVTIKKVAKVAKAGKTPSSGVEWTPNTPLRIKKPSIAKVKEVCEKYGVDRGIISNMMLSSKNADLTLDEVIQKHIRITAD